MKKIMVKILGIVVVSTLFVPSISACANQEETSACTNEEETGWKELASMPTSRSEFESQVIDGKIYITGGCWNSNYTKILAPTEVYDPSTNKWKKLASMPTARFGFQTVVVDDKMYVIGGKNLDNMELVSSTEVYDSSTNKWTTLAPMPIALWDHDDFKTEVVDGKIYVFGNILDVTCTAITEVYDPSTDTWAVLTPMTTPRSAFQTEVIDGKIYVIGGYSGKLIFRTDGGYSIDSISSAEVYDPSTDKWTTLASMSTTRCWFQTEVINGEIYAIGGHNVKVGDSKGKSLSSTEVYDPSTDKWMTLASMSTVRRAFQTEVVDDKIYAIGGMNSTSMESYAVPTNATK